MNNYCIPNARLIDVKIKINDYYNCKTNNNKKTPFKPPPLKEIISLIL